MATIFDAAGSTGPGYESVKRFESNPSRGMIPPRESRRTKGTNLVRGGSTITLLLHRPALSFSASRHTWTSARRVLGVAYDPSHGGG